MNCATIIKRFLTASILSVFAAISLQAQYTTFNAHSHNDYKNTIPFWLAYYNHFGSIEADIWKSGNDLLVAHDKADLKSAGTIDALYLNPVVKLFRYNDGRAWHDYPSTFQLLIEIKSETKSTLSLLVKKLQKYPDVFDPEVNKNAIRIVITGKVPKPQEFDKYPRFISFDGDLFEKYSPDQVKRVAMFSNDLEKFTSWKDAGEISSTDAIKLGHLIDSVHVSGEKIRFWNAPDSESAWKTLMKLGVDYINTDKINDLASFLNGLHSDCCNKSGK
jgi:alkaline phosphatase